MSPCQTRDVNKYQKSICAYPPQTSSAREKKKCWARHTHCMHHSPPPPQKSHTNSIDVFFFYPLDVFPGRQGLPFFFLSRGSPVSKGSDFYRVSLLVHARTAITFKPFTAGRAGWLLGSLVGIHDNATILLFIYMCVYIRIIYYEN